MITWAQAPSPVAGELRSLLGPPKCLHQDTRSAVPEQFTALRALTSPMPIRSSGVPRRNPRTS